MAVTWIFDPAPPSGKRTGGNAAEYSFQGKIDTLVREVVQNSLDARLSEDPVKVRFKIVDLSGDTLAAFLEALHWPGLEDNLAGVPEDRGGRAIGSGTKTIEEEGKLRLLIIEDRGTRGLEGTEQRTSDDAPNPYCALVRDDLYSDKADPSAGGSFGLGKSVLWAYSSLKTVLFCSVPANPPEGFSGVRFAGRASLPWHQTPIDGHCSGDGWLGVAIDEQGPSRHANSVWGEEAEAIAADTLCSRDREDRGLSIVVVGFSEPGEEDRSAADLLKAIADGALESFWPAIVQGELDIDIRTEENEEITATHEVIPDVVPGFHDLCELVQAFRAGTLDQRPRLEPGQSAMALVDLEVPKRLVDTTHPECTAKAAVLVHLLAPGHDADNVKDRIFRFRGPGMVIRSERKGNLSLAARPYVAAVLAGRAAGSLPVQKQAEEFLRAAEPPAHDEWTHNTRRVKQEYYAHGCKAKLDRFELAIRTAITKLISVPEEHGGQLPKAILRYLRFADTGGGGNPRFLSVTNQKASLEGDVWTFSATCRRLRGEEVPWHVSVRFKFAKDGGGGDDSHSISSLEADEATSISIDKGRAVVEFPANVNRVQIRGRTDPALMPGVGTRASVMLSVDGANGGIENV